MHRLVEFGALLGDAVTQSRRADSGNSMDSNCDGSVAFGNYVFSGIDCARGMVPGHNVDCLWDFQHARILPGRRSNTWRRTPLSDFSSRDTGRNPKYLYRFVHGTRCLVSNSGGRGVCGS